MSNGQNDSPAYLTARWILPVDRPPLADGVIEITGDRITDIGVRRGTLPPNTTDFGRAVVTPGFINAHAHLEFSDLAAPLEPARPFSSWIGRVIQHRRERSRDLPSLLTEGLAEVHASGTVAVGEIATGDWSPDFITASSPTVVAFRECLAPVSSWIATQRDQLEQHLHRCDAARSAGLPVRAAVSPHAPYTVLPEFFSELVQRAARDRLPLCLHLAETPAELEFLSSGTGELVEMLARVGLWEPTAQPRHRRPMDYLQELASVDRVILAHGNYLATDEKQFLAQHSQMSVAYCPRTHAFFGHGGPSQHPWRELLEIGVTVALGTDGRSSNPNYSLLEEAKFLAAAVPDFPRAELLKMATLFGARALGLESELGSLTVGKLARFCVFELSDTASSATFGFLNPLSPSRVRRVFPIERGPI